MLRDAEGERGERQIRENRLYDIVKFTWLQLIRAAGCMCSCVHAYVRVVPIDRDRCRIETELCYICTFCGWDDSVSVLYRNRGNFIHTTGASFGSTCYRLVKKKHRIENRHCDAGQCWKLQISTHESNRENTCRARTSCMWMPMCARACARRVKNEEEGRGSRLKE